MFSVLHTINIVKTRYICNVFTIYNDYIVYKLYYSMMNYSDPTTRQFTIPLLMEDIFYGAQYAFAIHLSTHLR